MEVWKAGSELYSLMRECIKRYRPELADIEDKIEIVFREKASTPRGRIIAGKTKKVPALLSVLSDVKALFLIEIGADEWQKYSATEKSALMTHHLCSISGTENAQTGEMTYGIVPPDFYGYRKEIEEFGVWRYTNTEDLEDGEDGEDVIDKLFGPNAPWVKDEEG